MLSFFKNISPTEWLIIALILLFFLGPKIIKALARTSGESVKEIKKIKKSFNDTVEDIKQDVKQ